MGDRYQMEFEWESSIFKGRMEKGYGWLEAESDEEAWRKAEKKIRKYKGSSKRKYDLKNVWKV